MSTSTGSPRQQLPDASGTDRGLGEEPTVALLLINRIHLFRHPVDISKTDLDHPGCDRSSQIGIRCPASQLLDTARQESAVDQPDTHGPRRCSAFPAAPASSRTRPQLEGHESPLERAHARRHGATSRGIPRCSHRGASRRSDRRGLPGDVGDQQLPDLVARFRQMCSDSRRNCGHLLGDGVAPALHPAIIAGA